MPSTENMTSPTGVASAHDPSASDVYDPDEVLPQNSPLMKPYRPKLKPSPSPPEIPLPLIQPSHGDVILLQHLDDGRHPDISREAGKAPLDSSEEDESGSESEDTMDESEEEDGIRSNDMSPAPMTSRFSRPTAERFAPDAASNAELASVNLQSLATNALAAAQAASKTTGIDDSRLLVPAIPVAFQAAPEPMNMEDMQDLDSQDNTERRPSIFIGSVTNELRDPTLQRTTRAVLAPPRSPYAAHSSPEMYSPRQHTPGQVLMHPNNVRSPSSTVRSPSSTDGELAPIQVASPKSESAGHETLPSIRSQLFEQLHGSPNEPTVRSPSHFPHSPSSRPTRLGSITGTQMSPPISPNDLYRNSIPSPASTLPGGLSPLPYGNSNGTSQRLSGGPDYHSNSGKMERVVDILTPPTDRIADRMSIDSMTNPQVGQFVCTFQGCNAPPFQTQYLLNSHANVHSSARPHYCPVKGCPRSEGGKGFKRKNEMIRHGLVHDSPGYVCPFCPDREHKYPRPDNLQRHVRVHHVDKDKDDPALRDVLAQRPDGPNRGRRRRGAP
ncbi:hypothetical protein F5Y18DRAFT_59572 [Xylariaceae sp. FL1019]|nr:hypothetical protein F5Y18DRAFT_59572 [Xylariaceae sp. FL1019]